MIKVNLVPAEILAKAQQKRRAIQFGLLGGLVALLVVAVSMGYVVKLKRLESKKAKMDVIYNNLSAVVAKVKQAEEEANVRNARLKVIEDLDKGRRAYPYFMCDFVKSVPAGVRVKTLSTKGGSSAPISLDIAAEARTNEDIAGWVKKMEEIGLFDKERTDLGPVSVSESAEASMRSFTLKTIYTPKL